MMATGATADVVEVGYFGAGQFIPCDELSAGMLLCFNLGDKAMQRDRYLVIRRNRSEMSTAALFSSFVLRHYNVEKN